MKIVDLEEPLFVVDKNNKPFKPLKRGEVHGFGIWHRTAHVWVFDGRGNILCHQRSLNKDSSLGQWAAIFGGHLDPSETNEHAAIRELFEEASIKVAISDLKPELIYRMHTSNDYNNEFQAVFSTTWVGDESKLVFDTNEVSFIEWLPIEEVLEHFEQNDANWSICGYEADLLKSKL
ncbi:MAG: NUDIX domain-containing protein [Candidatus Saccharibacteria bacterium]